VAASLGAEVIDRIVAVVEGHLITMSDLRQERQTRRALGEKPIDDDVALAKDLADTYLIERQTADYPNIDVLNEEIEAELQKLNVPQASPALREAIKRRIRIQKFFDLKFRDVIRPTDDEIRKYYDEVFVPEARKRGMQPIPPLADPQMTSAIRDNVIQERLDHEVDVWLDAIRRRSNVEILE
jgi:hypothetical protein